MARRRRRDERGRHDLTQGAIVRRKLHFILAVDTSGSMTGERIASLNYAVGLIEVKRAGELVAETGRVAVKRVVTNDHEVAVILASPYKTNSLGLSLICVAVRVAPDLNQMIVDQNSQIVIYPMKANGECDATQYLGIGALQ